MMAILLKKQNISNENSMKVFYINSCIRKNSRTKILADYLVKKISGDVKEIVLSEEKISRLINIYYKTKKFCDIILCYGRTSRL